MSVSVETTARELWDQSLDHLHRAMTFKAPMNAPLTQEQRDQATKAYVEAVDGLVDALAPLALAGFLDDIGGFLDTQFGRV